MHESANLIVVVTFLVVTLLLPITSLADQVVLIPSQDNTLYESVTGSTSNGAGEHFFVGATGAGQVRRGLIAFDIAGNLPVGATVMTVTLTLHMSKTHFSSGPETLSLHSVLAAWGEGASNALNQEGSGAPATTNDATWIHAMYPTSMWAAAGGDFTGTPSAAAIVDQVNYYTWQSAGMVADVQSWLDSPSTNFGWLVSGNEAATFTAKRFDTKENINAAFRPTLTVQFQPQVPVKPTTWGTIKSLYKSE